MSAANPTSCGNTPALIDPAGMNSPLPAVGMPRLYSPGGKRKAG